MSDLQTTYDFKHGSLCRVSEEIRDQATEPQTDQPGGTMKLEVGQTVKHTMAGPGGWHCANRTHRIGEVLKINVQRVTIRWEDGSKSSVGIDQVTILVMSKAA